MNHQDGLYASLHQWCKDNAMHDFNYLDPANSTFSPKLFSDIKGIYCNEIFFRKMLNERDCNGRYFNQNHTKFCDIPIYTVTDRNHPDAVFAG